MLTQLLDERIDERLKQLQKTMEEVKVPVKLSDIHILLDARKHVKNCKGCNGNSDVIIHSLEIATVLLYRELLEKEKFERTMA